jgi:hypothetical protein
VTAPLLQTGRMLRPYACNAFLTSSPPAGCSGVALRGYDFAHLPGVVHRGETWWTDRAFSLTGTWNGRVLALTRPPVERGLKGTAAAEPSRCRGVFSAELGAISRKIRAHASQIGLMQMSPCGSRVWVLVAVKDRATVGAIHRLGSDVLISGWLQRVA